MSNVEAAETTSENFNAASAKHLAALLCSRWQDLSLKDQSGGPRQHPVIALEGVVKALSKEVLLSASATNASGIEGSSATILFHQLNPVELCALLEVGEAALHLHRCPEPDAVGSDVVRVAALVLGHVVEIVHTMVVHAGANGLHLMQRNVAPNELGATVDSICDYLDLLLVPLVLQQPALTPQEQGGMSTTRCPCERCLQAVQCRQHVQSSAALKSLLKVSAVAFLSHILEQTAQALLEARVRIDSASSLRALRAAEALAVLGLHARLQEPAQKLHLPVSVVRALSVLLVVESELGGHHRPMLLGVLHVLRNVAANHEQIMQMTSEVLTEYSLRLWKSLETLPTEVCSASKHSDMSLPPLLSKFPSSPGLMSKGAFCDRDQRRARPRGIEDSSCLNEAAHVPRNSRVEQIPAVSDGANPQESDECASGAEFAPRVPPDKLGEQAQEGNGEQGDVVDGPLSSIGSSAGGASSACSLNPQSRCSELIGLYSLTMQALFQSDGPSHQRSLLSEENLRLQIVFVMDALRSSELLPQLLNKMAFQGLRIYLLVCRSSHAQRQYAVLQRSFIERERRTVAFLQSLAPPAQRCCALLHAMAQDVYSWLLWQMRSAPAAPSCQLGDSHETTSPAAPVSPASRLHRRSRRSRTGEAKSEFSESPHDSGARLSKSRGKETRGTSSAADALTDRVSAAAAARASEPQSSMGSPAEDRVERLFEEDVANLRCLFTSGEAVWLLHALVLFVVICCLVALWRSLEKPTQVWLKL